jgi:pimeloyl-CoA dehydrogenase
VFNVTMLGPVLMKFGTPAQCDRFLPKLANLDLWFCQGFSEPGSGSDLASLRTSARREGDHYVVNGQKIWTTSAHVADWVFALVRTDTEGRKQEGISFLLIDLKTPGITIRPIYSIDGEHHLNEVFFDEVRVPAGNLVGQENKGWDCAKFLLANERTGIANVGLCRERLDYARELATRNVQAGKPLLDDPNLRSEIATLQAEVRALEITNWRFLLTESEQRRLPAFASVLKLKGVELQQEINALLARIAGPGGLERRPAGDVVNGPVTPRYFYSRAASIYGGTSEVQKDILAKAIVG